MAINKVVYGNTTLVDLTEDTATEEDVMEGKTFHDASGQRRTGSATQGGRVQDVEVNGESVVNAQGIAELIVPVIDDEDVSNNSVYSSEKIEDRLDEYIDKDVAEEKSATTEFETYNGGLLSECKVALEPVQDLHGYSEPWVGGAGKNKMPITATSQTISGVTITVNDDGSFHVNGTATADIYLELGETSVSANTWIGSCGVVGSWSSYGIYIRNVTDNVTINIIDSQDFTFTLSATKTIRFILLIKSGQTVNTDFYPMLRLSTESDPTFAPYSNICPISGHTQVEVDVSDGQTTQEQVTVNLGGTYYSGTLDVVTGVFTPDTAFDTLSADNFNGETGTSSGGLHYYDWNNGLSKKSGICLCSMMPQNNTLAWQSTTPCIQMSSGGGHIRCYVEEATKEAFKTAYSGMQICYELDNPTPIQLSPTMVKALVGENHLSAPLEGQEIDEVKYKEAFDFNDVMKVANYFTLPLQTFTFTNKICNVNDSRVTSNSLVDVYFTSASMSSVEDAGITVESQNGKIVMIAEEQPVGTIQGRIKVVN